MVSYLSILSFLAKKQKAILKTISKRALKQSSNTLAVEPKAQKHVTLESPLPWAKTRGCLITDFYRLGIVMSIQSF